MSATLQTASGEAVTTLRNVLTDEFARVAEKISASRTILEYFLKSRDAVEVERRLKELEDRMGYGKVSE